MNISLYVNKSSFGSDSHNLSHQYNMAAIFLSHILCGGTYNRFNINLIITYFNYYLLCNLLTCIDHAPHGVVKYLMRLI